jgi:hypothetical protein
MSSPQASPPPSPTTTTPSLGRPPPSSPPSPPPPTKKSRLESFIGRNTSTSQDMNSNLSALNDNADALLSPPSPIYVIKELGTIDTSDENLTMIFEYINVNLPDDEEDDEGVNINNEEPFPRPGKNAPPKVITINDIAKLLGIDTSTTSEGENNLINYLLTNLEVVKAIIELIKILRTNKELSNQDPISWLVLPDTLGKNPKVLLIAHFMPNTQPKRRMFKYDDMFDGRVYDGFFSLDEQCWECIIHHLSTILIFECGMSYADARSKVMNEIVIADNIPFSHAATWDDVSQEEIAKASDPHMRVIMNAIIDYFTNINGVVAFGIPSFDRVFGGSHSNSNEPWFDNERYQINTKHIAHPQREAMKGMNEEEIRKLNDTYYTICGLIMNEEIPMSVASFLTFFQHPRQTLACQKARGRNWGLKGSVTRHNKYHTAIREEIGDDADDHTRCLAMYDDWCVKNIISDDEKELMARYERPDNEVCCVYIVYLSIIYVTCLLTYLDIILQWTYKVENESNTACLDVLFNKLKCKHCNLLIVVTAETVTDTMSYHRYAKFLMINHATSCKGILGTQKSSVVRCQGCSKTLLEIQNEYKYSDQGVLNGWERHTSNCEGIHYDKVHEAFVAMFGDDVGVNKRGHKNNGTLVTLVLPERMRIRGEWTNKILLNAKLCTTLFNYVARLKERN